MEAAGAVAIFKRSVEERGIRYKVYLGDGDSKGFHAVVNEKPYGDEFQIVKSECVNHVAKRVTRRLNNLVAEYKKPVLVNGKKVYQLLSDKKKINGRGRLTAGVIASLRSLYKKAILDNSQLGPMKQACWAVVRHQSSTDQEPDHGDCPTGPDSWCRYNRLETDEERKAYRHRSSLPKAIAKLMEPIWTALTSDDLLSACLHGKSQNQNESFNKVVWDKIPKTTFVGLDVFRIGVLDAIIDFNDGSLERLKIFDYLGILYSTNTVDILSKIYETRLAQINKNELTILRNASSRISRPQEEEDGSYDPGMY